MAPRRVAKSQETELSSQPPEQSDCDLEDVLLAKVVEQIDVHSLLSIDVLKDRLLDLLVCKIAEDPELVGAVSTYVMAQPKA